MKNIVITGSTRGIGYGLASAFLELGCAVTISGRSEQSVDKAVDQLVAIHGDKRVHGHPCDVTQLDQAEKLWTSAKARFGVIDIWICNAGVGHAYVPLWELPPEEIVPVIDTNVTGLIYSAQVAVRGMMAQNHGQLYLMLGRGADGKTQVGMSVYGATKSAVNYISQSLLRETKEMPVQIGTLSPGMVASDFLLDRLRDDPEILARSGRILNILTDHVETVTPWLARKVLANNRSGVEIKWLTTSKILWRFVTSLFIKRDIFGEVL